MRLENKFDQRVSRVENYVEANQKSIQVIESTVESLATKFDAKLDRISEKI